MDRQHRGAAFALSSPAAGCVVARFGYRRVYLASILLWVIAGSLPALTNDLRVVLGLRVLLGVSVAGALTAALDGIAHLPAEQRPTLFGLQALFGSLSAVAAYPVVGFLSKSGWHLRFAVHLVGLLVVPLVLTLPRSAPASVPADGASAEPRQGMLAGVSLALCLFAGLVGVAMFIMQIVAPFYLVTIGMGDPALAAVPLTAMALASMAAAGGYGMVHRFLGTIGTFVSVTLIIGTGLLICGSAQSLAIFTMGTVLMGGGLSVAAPNLYTAALADRDGPRVRRWA